MKRENISRVGDKRQKIEKKWEKWEINSVKSIKLHHKVWDIIEKGKNKS